MAKLSMVVQLKKDNGQNIGASIAKEGPTHSAVKALVDAEIQARLDAATASAADIAEAQSAFNI